MTKYKPGDVVLIPYPFSDLSGVKQRPALVLASIESQNEAVCLMLTSQYKGGNYEYAIKNGKNLVYILRQWPEFPGCLQWITKL